MTVAEASSCDAQWIENISFSRTCGKVRRMVEDLEAAVPVGWGDSLSIRHNLNAYDLCVFVEYGGAKFNALWRLIDHVISRLEGGDMEQAYWCVDNPMGFKSTSEDGRVFVVSPLCNPLHRNVVRWYWRSGAASVIDRDIATDQVVVSRCGYLLSGGRLTKHTGEVILLIASGRNMVLECEHSSGRVFEVTLRSREAVMFMGARVTVREGAGVFCVLAWSYNWNIVSRCKVTSLEVRAKAEGGRFDMANEGFSVIACPHCLRPSGILVEPEGLRAPPPTLTVGKCLLVCVYSRGMERSIERLGEEMEWYGSEYERLLLVPRGCSVEGSLRYWPVRKEVKSWMRHPYRYRGERSRPVEPGAGDLTLPDGCVSRRCFKSDRDYGTDCFTAVEALEVEGCDTVFLMESWWRCERPVREILKEVEMIPSVSADGGFMVFEPKQWQAAWLKSILSEAEHPAQQQWKRRPLRGLLVAFWRVAYGRVGVVGRKNRIEVN